MITALCIFLVVTLGVAFLFLIAALVIWLAIKVGE